MKYNNKEKIPIPWTEKILNLTRTAFACNEEQPNESKNTWDEGALFEDGSNNGDCFRLNRSGKKTYPAKNWTFKENTLASILCRLYMGKTIGKKPVCNGQPKWKTKLKRTISETWSVLSKVFAWERGNQS